MTLLVFWSRKTEHSTPLLRDLQWPRALQRIIEFKLTVLAFRCLHGLAEHSMHASCIVWRTLTHGGDCVPRPHLRSTCHRRVMLPSATVPLASPMSSDLTSSASLSVFQRRLKTFLFTGQLIVTFYFFDSALDMPLSFVVAEKWPRSFPFQPCRDA